MTHRSRFHDLFPDALLASHETGEAAKAHPGVDADVLRAAFRLGRAADQILTNMTRAIDDSGLTPARWRLLGVLAWRLPASGSRATELARALGVTPATTTRLVDGLVTRGLVERVGDASDRRATLVCLTDEGRSAVELTLPRLGHEAARLVKALGGAEATLSLSQRLDAALEMTDE